MHGKKVDSNYSSASFHDFNVECNMLCWNINGMKNKFLTEDVQELFDQYDVVILNETHLNIRDKCPKDFIFIGRSEPIESLTPRGGVAVFKRVDAEISLEIISKDFRDCVIFRILPLDVV